MKAITWFNLSLDPLYAQGKISRDEYQAVEVICKVLGDLKVDAMFGPSARNPGQTIFRFMRGIGCFVNLFFQGDEVIIVKMPQGVFHIVAYVLPYSGDLEALEAFTRKFIQLTQSNVLEMPGNMVAEDYHYVFRVMFQKGNTNDPFTYELASNENTICT